MNSVALRDAGVAHLEYLFSPPGLPLVGKGGSAPPTTSVLVRGPAGAGKTTLSIAVAHAIATAGGGSVYYLSTEIAPADAVRKGEQAGVERRAIADARTPPPDAHLYVDHLAAHVDPEEEDPGERTQRALVRAWEWVEAHATTCTPRALVIDAFSLVGATHAKEERTRLLQLIQALESLGVTPVLVEEAGATGADWAAYLVDLVFELGWGTDPDTGHRYRTLACPKSRYADVAYGPHDYGRENGRIAVWPPLMRVVEAVRRGAVRAPFPTVWLPVGDWWGGRNAALASGSLVGQGQPGALPPLGRRLPWVSALSVELGAVSRLEGEPRVLVSEGPHAIGWTIFQHSLNDPTWIDVHGLSSIGARPRFRDSLRDDLEALATLGAIVVVHDTNAGLDHERLHFTHRTGDRDLHLRLEVPTQVPALVRLSGADIGSVTNEIGRIVRGLREAVDRPALLRYTAITAAYTDTDVALDWLLALTDPDERTSVAPWVAAALARRGRTDEARAWVELALTALPPRTPEQLAAIEAALTAPAAAAP